MKAWAEKFYKSKEWNKCRSAFIQERIATDGGICQMCNEHNGYIVHHIKELTPENIDDPNITLNFNNLQYVCKRCHDEHHGYFCPNKNRIYFDENGQPVPPKIF